MNTNDSKTCRTRIGYRHKSPCADFTTANGLPVPWAGYRKYLGLTIYGHLDEIKITF